jgi:hypothetical protein
MIYNCPAKTQLTSNANASHASPLATSVMQLVMMSGMDTNGFAKPLGLERAW